MATQVVFDAPVNLHGTNGKMSVTCLTSLLKKHQVFNIKADEEIFL